MHASSTTLDPSTADATGAMHERIYTPSQVAMGALLGGPMAAIYFLWANFQALGRARAAGRTLGWGVFAFAAMVLLMMLAPRGLPNLLLTLATIVLAGQIATHWQMNRHDIARSHRFARASSWRVVGIGLACSLLSMTLAVLFALVFRMLGVPVH